MRETTSRTARAIRRPANRAPRTWFAVLLSCVAVAMPAGSIATQPDESLPRPSPPSNDPAAIDAASSGAAAELSAAEERQPASLAQLPALVECALRLDQPILTVGSPVMAEFVLRNRTSRPVTVQVPGATATTRPWEGQGLPLEYVFSGERFRALRIVGESKPFLGDRVALSPEYPVPLLTISPFASVGLRFDLARFYPVLHQAGRYELTWQPMAGVLTHPPVTLTVQTFKVVVLDTTQGRLTLRLLYDQAPRTVANFLELVESHFYDGKTFHRVEPNFVAQGGCPLGNGTGRRPDGRTLGPEFNDTPFDFGTVGLSLLNDDAKSGSCQFFIALSRLKALDGRYTAFAQVEGPDSLETLRRITSVQTDAARRPIEPLLIKNAFAIDAPSLR